MRDAKRRSKILFYFQKVAEKHGNLFIHICLNILFSKNIFSPENWCQKHSIRNKPGYSCRLISVFVLSCQEPLESINGETSVVQ